MYVCTGKQAAEEAVDGGGEARVAAVGLELDLPPDRDAVHVDLHEHALLVLATARLCGSLGRVDLVFACSVPVKGR